MTLPPSPVISPGATLPNLIPASRLQARRTAAAARMWVGINCAGVLVLAAVWALMASTRDSGAEKLETQVSQLDASIAEAQTALKKSSADLVNLTRQLAAVPDIRERPEWGVLLTTLGGVKGDSIALVTLDLVPYEAVLAGQPKPVAGRAGLPSRYQLRLGGLAKDHRSATGFSLAVERTGLFSQVRLTDASSQTSKAGTVVGFTIECVLDDPAGGP